MTRDIVIIPAKGIKTGKTRLSPYWQDYARQALNVEQLNQTVSAAVAVYGGGNTHVVSGCSYIEGVARRNGTHFIPEVDAVGLGARLCHP